MFYIGMAAGMISMIAADLILDYIESRRSTPTLDELNEINRELYAADRAQLAENLRQIRS